MLKHALAVALLISSVMPVKAQIAADTTAFGDQSTAKTTVATATFSTTSSNELLLAFIETDYLSGANTSVQSVSGAGLTWALVGRTNVQKGSSEIWRAFSATPLSGVTVTATLSQSIVASITVMSFTGIDTSGVNGAGAIGAVVSANASTGAPTATLTTTRAGSLVVGVGNDYDKAVSRTLGTSQTMIHQYLTPTGDTYWVQRQTNTTPLSGAAVTINDTAPTGDRYNLTICEILAATAVTPTFSISGSITPAATSSGTVLNLTGASIASTTADGSGNYSFSGLANGSYIVTPTKAGFTFTPPSQTVTISGGNLTGVNFTVAANPTWSIGGSITPAALGSGAAVALSGAATANATADGSGNYSFTSLVNGAYTVTPSKSGFSFTPPSQTVTVAGADLPGVNFTATANPTWSISGSITPAPLGSGATISVSGASSASATADGSGNYTVTNLNNGSYTVTPSKNGSTFNPTNQQVSINGANVGSVNFTASAQTNSISLDVNVSKDGAGASSTIATPSFSTSASNEVLVAFIATDYLGGANTTVQSVTGGGLSWALVARANGQPGSSEIWRALAATPLANVTVTATLSQSVISSITLMSFSGANGVGATATKSATTGAPSASLVTTGNNSWVLGVGNDYDKAVVRTVGSGQTLVHQYLTPAADTYWLQMQASPIPASGTTVTINDTAPTADRWNLSLVEIISVGGGSSDGTPPTVSMTSPAPGTIASLATVSAVASDNVAVAGVQFLLDGNPVGAEVLIPPYSMTWNSATAANGAHTLSARARDGSGLSTTSSPVNVTVDNSGNAAVVGSWSTPVTLPTVAVNLILLQNNKVLAYQDGSTPTVWDYVANTFSNVPMDANLFCSGHALLADGRVLVVGGYGGTGLFGIANAEIFDPVAVTWTSVPNMAFRRWYPTATTLPDGRILVTAGWQTTAHTNAGISEIYNLATNTWTQLTNANNPFETYPFLYVLPDGRVIHLGGTEFATDTDVLDLNTQTWSVIDPNIVDGASATMYLPSQFMKAGSATDSQGVGPSSNTTFVLDMTQPTPAWRQTPSMAYPRSFMNLTMLPDGNVLATGGETDKNGGTIANAVYAAELWSPTTQTWSTMASMHTPREYHGTALLLPDARVLVSGMGADFGQVPDQKSAEFYSPPYLFKGARPTISQSPAHISYGASFFVGTPDAATISKAVLIRTGAVTHFFDQNERYVPVSFTQTSGGLQLTAPLNANLAPPGMYMLFLVNSSGVPSVAPFVQLQ